MCAKDSNQRITHRSRLLPAFALSAAMATPTMSAEIFVDTTADDLAVNNNCTLREAVLASNLDVAVDQCAAGDPAPMFDMIHLPAGHYVLTLGSSGDAEAGSGDLDVVGFVQFFGSDARTTVIDANGLDRAFETSLTSRVSFADLSLIGGVTDVDGGGAILNHGVLFLDRVALIDNHTTGDGGGLSSDNSFEARAVLLAGNSAQGDGGGLFNAGNGLVENVTFSSNHADGDGGALTNDVGSQLTLFAVTVAGNSAQGAGDALATIGPLTTRGSIFDGSCVGSSTSLGGNLESPGSTCGLNQPDDQVSVPELHLSLLLDHGGATDTHALFADSPALDAWDSMDCPASDQRDLSRPIDGDSVPGAVCDAGAFEAQSAPPLFADGFESGDVQAWV